MVRNRSAVLHYVLDIVLMVMLPWCVQIKVCTFSLKNQLQNLIEYWKKSTMKKKLRKKYYYADGRNEPYSHDTIICPSKSLQFYYKRPTSEYDKELEDDHNEVQPHQASDCFNGDPKLKDDQSQNQNQPHEADHFDDISKSDCLIFQPLLVVQKENEKEDGFSANILHDQNFCEERLCTQITIVDSSLNMASKELDKKLELKERLWNVSRAFGDKNLKSHLRCDPDVTNADIDGDIDLLILASDGLWKVMSNQEAVDIAKKIKDPQKAAKELAAEALNRESKDDFSCIVIRFKGLHKVL
ncbi:hypothetical protein F0562_009164 [Nyssa sinensis]|uniref:PPM-type phosphatase domain-containing protein n=1 Tax=Nyssa sinensis TaxID=561372 RepID=A0A5J4ZXN6_9ASTE|nr:hypothetical protein F0562_009164 [Nyssa sinensis]